VEFPSQLSLEIDTLGILEWAHGLESLKTVKTILVTVP
jgi:hypothetical protein